MPENYDYFRLIGLLAIIAGMGKLLLGIIGYQYGSHYLSSSIILGIGIVVFIIGTIMKKSIEE